MSVVVKNIVHAIEQYAPKYMAEKWDNVGLLSGNLEQKVDKVMVALDVTPDIVQQAIKEKVQMIVSHHPLIFTPIKSLAETNWQNKMLVDIIRNNIAVYCAHTNLDITNNGVNDVLARKIGLTNIKPLSFIGSKQLRKIVVFVPIDYVDKVATAMISEGAGHIGRYSDCTFKVEGIGTFRPLEDANPFIGKVNDLEEVKEIRLETVVAKDKEQQVLQAMLESHPYEEVAYDIYALLNEHNKWGLGRIGELDLEMSLIDFAKVVKKSLKLEYVLYSDAGKKVKKVAVCGGSGSELVSLAKSQGADVLVSADFKYHSVQQANFSGLSIIDAGHQGTELPVVEAMREYLTKHFAKADVAVVLAKEDFILNSI